MKYSGFSGADTVNGKLNKSPKEEISALNDHTVKTYTVKRSSLIVAKWYLQNRQNTCA